MAKLTLKQKLLIGGLIWAIIMVVLLSIYFYQVAKNNAYQQAVASNLQTNLAYQQQAAKLLSGTRALGAVMETLVLPQVDNTLRLE